MQTYTHAALGAVIGAMTSDDPIVWAACAAGSCVPDLILIPKFAFDKRRGVKPFVKQSKALLACKEVVHSFFVWAMLCILCSLAEAPDVFTAFVLGGIVHIVVDIATHKGAKYEDTDPGFAWPLGMRLTKMFGLWEYRYDFGVLKPKPFELGVLIFCATLFNYLVW